LDGNGKHGEEILKDPVLAAAFRLRHRSCGQTQDRPPDKDGYQKVQEFMRQYVNAGGKLIAVPTIPV
jgi:hypothetical protein